MSTVPDHTVPLTTSASRDLIRAVRDRAEARGMDLAKHTADLWRSDLLAAGLPVPPPLPPKRNGPKSKRARAKR